METIIFITSIILTIVFVYKWYKPLVSTSSIQNRRFVCNLYTLLPIVFLVILISILTTLAASDVINDGYYITYYIFLGFAWAYISVFILFSFLDISWIDDGINNNNKAAAISVAGGLTSLMLIYAGANIGEGPGWWTVVFASFLGLLAFILLIRFFNAITNIISKVTSDRDINAGIRFSFYLLALGIILGKASSGDWTSFIYTVYEFFIGWSAIILTIIAIIIELLIGRKKSKFLSISIGLVYIAFAIISLLYLVDLIDFVEMLV